MTHRLLTGAAMLLCGCALTMCTPSRRADAHHLVILHTNDTHSSIDPDRHGGASIAQRKAIVDSVRAARCNVLLVDAGDAVQGSLYFTVYGGEVERMLMDSMHYDLRTLGNHEFDRGIEGIAREWGRMRATPLASNYDFTGTAADGIFRRSDLRVINGHKIGFLSLNLDPAGMIAAENCRGMAVADPLATADSLAADLRAQGAEMVVALSHLGYSGMHGMSDTELARRSHGIDIILGGHSHTVINPTDPSAPAWRIANADGDTVTVLQTGGRGMYVGEVDIDLEKHTATPRLIAVDSRLDDRLDPAFTALIDPYRHGVDSLRAYAIGATPNAFERGSTRMLNLFSDFVRMRGSQICGKPADLAIMNKGGIRNSLDSGTVTKGEIIDIAPFENRVVVLDIAGSDLLDNIGVMCGQEGQGVSSNVSVLYDPSTHRVSSVTVDGRPLDPTRRYRLATIDYLAAGNDYMTPLQRATMLARSKDVLYEALIEYIGQGRLDAIFAAPDDNPRMKAF